MRRQRPKPKANPYAGLLRARAAPWPGFIEPMHPERVAKPPRGDNWLHEVKVDGYRCQLHIRDGAAAGLTRRGEDWSDRFQAIVDDAKRLQVTEAIIDGEVVVPLPSGLTDFAMLQSDLGAKRTDRLIFYAFDLLYADGYDLRSAPLLARKESLRELVARAKSHRVQYSEHMVEDGPAIYERACAAGLEGIVSKKADGRYRSGVQPQWTKAICTKRDTFVVIGFAPSTAASKRGGIEGVYIARKTASGLTYAGKVEHGFTTEAGREMRKRLEQIRVAKPPVVKPINKPKAVWARPDVLVDVQFRGVTEIGLLRHASFKGVREDLMGRGAPESPKASQVRQKQPTSPGAPRRGSDRTGWYNIQRRLEGAEVASTEELLAYWRKVGKEALRYIANRPLTLVRHYGRRVFFHEQELPLIAAGVHTFSFARRKGGTGERVYVDTVKGLLGLVQMDVIELHAWNCKVGDVEHADQIVFDLDPGEGIEWEFVTETALHMRGFLKVEGLDCWPKATGGKGLHIVVPLDGTLTHDNARDLSHRLAARFADRDPDRYTVLSALKERPGKVFIDYLRNGRGQSSIAPYSPRARRNFPVAAPLSWTEVERGLPSDAYTLGRPPARL